MNDDALKLAKQRFWVLQAIRFSGLALVAGGVANIAGKFLPDLAPVLGGALLVTGVVDYFILPIVLKRGWRSNDA